jgi:hypothetical protein
VGSSEPSFNGVSVLPVDGGTAPPALVGAALLPPVDPGAGHAIPVAAAPVVVSVAVGVDEPPQAVAMKATPMPSAVSLAARAPAWGNKVIYELLDLKVRTAFDAKNQVFLI